VNHGDRDTHILDGLLDEIEELRKGRRLLERIYHQLGPYCHIDQEKDKYSIPDGAYLSSEIIFVKDETGKIMVRNGRVLTEKDSSLWADVLDYFGFDDSE
jgi:hypothetical protein